MFSEIQRSSINESSRGVLEKKKFKSSMSAINGMNIVEFMKEHPNMKIRRNKKVNYRTFASSGSDGTRGL